MVMDQLAHQRRTRLVLVSNRASGSTEVSGATAAKPAPILPTLKQEHRAVRAYTGSARVARTVRPTVEVARPIRECHAPGRSQDCGQRSGRKPGPATEGTSLEKVLSPSHARTYPIPRPP